MLDKAVGQTNKARTTQARFALSPVPRPTKGVAPSL